MFILKLGACPQRVGSPQVPGARGLSLLLSPGEDAQPVLKPRPGQFCWARASRPGPQAVAGRAVPRAGRPSLSLVPVLLGPGELAQLEVVFLRGWSHPPAGAPAEIGHIIGMFREFWRRTVRPVVYTWGISHCESQPCTWVSGENPRYSEIQRLRKGWAGSMVFAARGREGALSQATWQWLE